jgi:hypothetical protein
MKRIHVVVLLATVLSLSQLACSGGNQANAPANASTQNSNTPILASNTANTANTAPTSEPANSNASNDPFPELVMLYSQLFTARMKGDKAKVESLLADDYKETTADGKVLNRAQVLASINQDKKSNPFSLDDLKSTTNGDTGFVTGRVTLTTEGHTETWQFNDTFNKRQGRWQAVSSKITNHKKS